MDPYTTSSLMTIYCQKHRMSEAQRMLIWKNLRIYLTNLQIKINKYTNLSKQKNVL